MSRKKYEYPINTWDCFILGLQDIFFLPTLVQNSELSILPNECFQKREIQEMCFSIKHFLLLLFVCFGLFVGFSFVFVFCFYSFAFGTVTLEILLWLLSC